MTAEEWKEVEEKLKTFYDSVKLKCDGYEITMMLRMIGQFKNGILVYVNGEINGKWLTEECEESKRFYRKVTKSVGLSKAQKQHFSKLPKKLQKKLGQRTKYSYYCEYWTSFNSLKRQLIRENKSIELIQET